MGQRYHCHNKCYTLAAVGVMSSGKPHQSHDRPVVYWLGPDLVHHVSDCAPLPVYL